MRVYQQPENKVEQEREFQLLALNGISDDSKKRQTKKKYRFFIYQLDVVAIFQSTKNQEHGQPWIYSHKKQRELWKQVSVRTATKEVKKSKKMAIRSLYLLGYDLGMVEVCVYPAAPKFTVSQIFHHSRLVKQLDSTLKQMIKKYKSREKENIKKNPKLGADVEFVLRHRNGKYVTASRYFPKKGKVGYDAIWLRGNRNKHPLVELRPNPSVSPRNLYNHLHRCMRLAINKINNAQIEWIAGGNPLKRYPIGGHIHFSQIHLTPKLIRSLDNYLTLPLCVMESDESLSRRPKYGFLGDYREQFHGGFEYRTPPSWIVTPAIAKGVLCLSKVIANDYHQLTYFPLDSYEVQYDFYEGNREALYPVIRTTLGYIRKCPTFNKYQIEIEQFYDLIDRRFIWDEYEDIRKAWELPPYQS